MDSWAAPDLPALPGRGLELRVHDTLTDELRPVAAGPVATMYVCGITPYDATHIGHAATYLTYDLVQRVLRDAGHAVRYVQNITDVDDPLLARAAETGEDWQALASREIALFREDMTSLRVLPPEAYVPVTEAVDLIADLVARMRDAGAAYDVDGDVYFSVAAAPRFGELSRLSTDEMLALSAERGGDPARPGKKDPLDALLWQAARPGEPAWDSPLGRGRPGWHIECAAIAMEHFGPTMDLHGGGTDLVFPHHEMCSAEASVATGEWPFARTWLHSALVGLDGEKMSKSLGNLVFVHRLREDHDGAAIRLAILAHHYRSPWDWTDADLTTGEDRLARWRAAVALGAGPAADGVLAGVRRHLSDDLDAPGALSVVDRWVSDALRVGGDHAAAPVLVRDTVGALLGIAL